MQADVTLGVIIAAFAPPFGAAIIILFCLQSYVSLHIGQYNCIIDTYNRMLHKKEKSVFTYTLESTMYVCIQPIRHILAHNLHHAACPSHRLFHHCNINIYQYSGGDGADAKYRAVRPAPKLALHALHLLQKKDADCNQFFDVFDALPLFISGETTIKRRT
ncbi:hypothetical protein KSF_034010 [Reticulibacter mediterranei]|uniref:Uncharacterized protein n=1 Tax=Reticulibacter mediterranei TaxID=2778369 RepID=A0A8J3N2C1_9CHLR|nr:hypothetical protein [Reticulibacter mediterranei]GHO93353.1 hypothetical protein KSF_034010 [Reticulibacter mediterranei]